MSVKIKIKDWNDETLREATLAFAESLGEDVEIIYPKTKFKPYNVQIWKDDDILEEKDFLTKNQAKKWIRGKLSLNKYRTAYADLKKYNKSNDDFDWWFYKWSSESSKIIEINSPEE